MRKHERHNERTAVHTTTASADPPESPWRTLSSREVYRNPWLSVVEHQVIRPDGAEGIYGVTNPGGNAAIVALDDTERVVLVGEFCYPIQRYQWSIPSGKVKETEDPLVAAKRELAEETGVEADDWLPLGMYYLSPGISTQVSSIYLARHLRQGAAQPEGTEVLRMRRVPLREALHAALANTLRDAPTVLGIWRAWFHLHPPTDTWDTQDTWDTWDGSAD